MNTGIAISFVIGGLLLISIITLNARVIQNSGETVLNMSAKQKVETVNTVVTRDFNRIGLNLDDPDDDIITGSPSSTSFQFRADVDDDHSDSSPATTITWEFQSSGFITRTNSAHSDTVKVPLKSFQFTFYDENNNSTTNPDLIRSVKVQFEAESDHSYGNSDKAVSLFEKRFTPAGLNIQRIR